MAENTTETKTQTLSLPCAACRLLRRRCTKDCILAPHFPSSNPHKFFIVHKFFGASNISKLLREVRGEEREDAVNSLVYEARAREKDPIYGCVGTISYLHNMVSVLQAQLANAHAEILCVHLQLEKSCGSMSQDPSPFLHFSPSPSHFVILPDPVHGHSP